MLLVICDDVRGKAVRSVKVWFLGAQKETCGVKNFEDYVLMKKLCWRADTEVVEPQPKCQRIISPSKYHQINAIEGWFRILSLPVGYKPDHKRTSVELERVGWFSVSQ